jgi:hypothetical protein
MLFVCGLLAVLPARADPLTLYLHVPMEDAKALDVAMRVGMLLLDEGFDVVDLRPVPVQMKLTTVRYFKPNLRGEAAGVKTILERVLHENRIEDGPVRVQDFTFYRPTPTMHSLEVWFKPAG